MNNAMIINIFNSGYSNISYINPIQDGGETKRNCNFYRRKN